MTTLVVKKLGSLPLMVLALVGALGIASAAAVATLSVSSTSTALTLQSEALSVDEATVVDIAGDDENHLGITMSPRHYIREQ